MYILKWYHFLFYSIHFHFLRFSKFVLYSHVFMVKHYSYFSDHFHFFRYMGFALRFALFRTRCNFSLCKRKLLMMFETLVDHHCNFFHVLDVFNILCIMK